MDHKHKYLVTKDSVWGLENCQVVGACVVRDCKARIITLVKHCQLERTGTLRFKYFYSEKTKTRYL